MKKLRILILLCFLCILGSTQDALYAQTYQLDIYQIKVSVGHATLVVVSNVSTSPRTVISSNLIDTGLGDGDATIIKGVIDNVADSKLDNIFLSHGDEDHVGGTKKLSEYFASGSLNCRNCGNGSNSAKSATTTLHSGYVHSNSKPSIFYQDNRYFGNHLSRGTNSTFSTWWSSVFTTPSQNNSMNRVVWLANEQLDLITGSSNPSFSNPVLKTHSMSCYVPGDSNGNPSLDGCGSAAANASLSAVHKNNRSSVLTIEWGDFKFLIQGDLEGSTNGNGKAEIGLTVAGISEWNKKADLYETFVAPSTGLSSARSIYPSNVSSPDRLVKIQGNQVNNTAANYFSQGVERAKWTGERSSRGAIDAAIIHATHRSPVAIPDRGRYNLFNTAIGEVCVALIPHHGALTSNLWYTAGINVYGTPKNAGKAAGFYHPRIANIIAAKTQTGGKANFYTYTENKGGDRNTVLSAIKSAVPESEVRHNVLDDLDTFWNFRVEQNNKARVKIYKGSTYINATGSTIEYGSVNSNIGFNCNFFQ